MNTYKIKLNGIDIILERLPNGKFKKPEISNKYGGYKYSIAPLKQVVEEIMIFQKPYKTGSCLHDTLAYENGDEECCCGALDIGGNRVGTEKVAGGASELGKNGIYGKLEGDKNTATINTGRFPAQTLISSEAAKVIDKQSGVSKPRPARTGRVGGNNGSLKNFAGSTPDHIGYWPTDDGGGASRILHICDFEKGEHDLYFYNPKVIKSERNAGCESMEDKNGRNSHPTLKPIALNKKILSLFKTPNHQRLLVPFAGAGSEVIGAILAGFDDVEGCEINPEYIEIAKARIKHWSKKPEQKKLI